MTERSKQWTVVVLKATKGTKGTRRECTMSHKDGCIACYLIHIATHTPLPPGTHMQQCIAQLIVLD